MTESQQQMQPMTPRKRTNPIILFLMAAIPAAAIVWSMYQTQVRKPVEANQQMNSELVYNTLGRPGDPVPLKLAEKFRDADGDLVADPAEGADQVDPPTILFSYVGTSQTEGERLRERFKEFVAYLSSKTGRPVEFSVFNSPEEELKALCMGKLHVAGVNTGNIPTAVNQCGFVPICGLATDQGVASYQMQIIVPADSPIQKLEDLRGRELTLTEPGSNSGFKAPLVLLARDHNIKPGRDFNVRYSGGHEASIEGIANKTYQAAAVAGDVLKRVMGEDPPKLKKEQFRVIYESENFPTAGFGYVSTLKPDLAAKVKDAFFSFQWKGTGVEREFAASAQTKFIAVSFKNDFALVRRIDDEIRSVRTDMEEPTTMKMEDGATTRPATTQQ
jgi:phosphonate transport system substrate-binding protein